jgi:phosphate transport system protein
MTQHEQRSKEALLTIHTRVQAVAQEIERGLDNAVQATLRGDHQLANRVVLGDKPINREIRAIDTECHEFVAGHLPSAGHLRYVSSVLRLNVELERIGDYAVTIAREAVQLSTVPSGSVAGDIQLIAEQARQMFGQAMDSFNDQSPELARETKRMARQVEGTYQKVFDDLIREGETGARPMRDLFALLVIFNRLGRVGDQAKNICEETVFAVTGKTKAEKVYRILFLDKRNDAISQLARAYAANAFPESGQYTCAGWAPAKNVLPTLEEFMKAEGLDGDEMTPQQATCTVKELARFHVVVCLGHGAAEQIEEVPFHTVLLEWEVEPIPFDLDPERATALLESTFTVLKSKIRELMETLRGEESR